MNLMKEPCIVCGGTQGKRACRLHSSKLICPVCCVSARNEQCQGCSYFQVSKQYQRTKVIPFPKQNSEIDDEIDQALEMLEKGAIDQGATILMDLLKEYPENCSVLFGVGILHTTRKQYDEAIGYFEKASEISPDYIEAYYNIGVAYKEKLDIYNMLRAFLKVSSIGNPREPIVQNANKLLAEWNQHLLTTNKTNIDGYLRGSEFFDTACNEMEQLNWQKAIKFFKKVLSITANNYQSYGNLGICYAKLGKKGEALHAIDQALLLNSDYEVAIVNKAIISDLEEGECLKNEHIEIIDYAKDYSLKNKSYIAEMQSKITGPT
jgi:superkiller protein 3